MAYPGVKVPPSHAPKDSDGCSELPLAEGAKTVKCEHLDFVRGQPADLESANGPTAPTSRVYTRDYRKKGREPDDVDLITDALGRNPFRI
jgi:hypothetical protein